MGGASGAPAAPRRQLGDLGRDMPIEHDTLEMTDRVRSRDQITLDLVAAFRAQSLELLGRLDTFGQYRHAEAVAETDHRADDRARLRTRDVLDEAAVDLDLVER